MESKQHKGGESSESARGKPDNTRPWCWQEKAARRKIRDALDRSDAVASGLGVYDALTEIASDKQADRFETTHAWIAQLSGLSPRTVGQRVSDLEELGLIKVHTPEMKAPSTYILLSLVPQPLPNDRQPVPNVRQRTFLAPLPTSEECTEESSEESKKKRFAPPTLEQVKLLAAKAGLSEHEAEKFFNYYSANGWRVGRNPMRSLPHAVANWKLNAHHFKGTANENKRNTGLGIDTAEQGRKIAAAVAARNQTR